MAENTVNPAASGPRLAAITTHEVENAHSALLAPAVLAYTGISWA
jgi:hypothetical protein